MLRRQAVEHSRERDRLPNVRKSTYPRDRALDAQAESGVGESSITADVQVPLESRTRQFVRFEGGFQRGQVVLSLAAADDFAVPLRREDVHVERLIGVGGVALEVEGLQLSRIAMNDDRPIEAPADRRFFVAAEVVAHLRLGVSGLV